MSAPPTPVSGKCEPPASRCSFDFVSNVIAPAAAPATGLGRGTLRPRNSRGLRGTRSHPATLLGMLVVATAPFVAAPPPRHSHPDRLRPIRRHGDHPGRHRHAHGHFHLRPLYDNPRFYKHHRHRAIDDPHRITRYF